MWHSLQENRDITIITANKQNQALHAYMLQHPPSSSSAKLHATFIFELSTGYERNSQQGSIVYKSSKSFTLWGRLFISRKAFIKKKIKTAAVKSLTTPITDYNAWFITSYKLEYLLPLQLSVKAGAEPLMVVKPRHSWCGVQLNANFIWKKHKKQNSASIFH